MPTTIYRPSCWGQRASPWKSSILVNEANNVAAIYNDTHREEIVNSAQDALEAISEARFATTRSRAIDSGRMYWGRRFKDNGHVV